MARARARSEKTPLFDGYRPLERSFDEYWGGGDAPLPTVAPIVRQLDALGSEELARRRKLADATFLRSGVTFSVYSEDKGRGGTERIFPFDLIPRIVSQQEWHSVEAGLVQRIAALNAFLNDVYGDQRILREGVVPRALVEGSAAFLPQMRGIRPPHGVYIHIGGIDLIRDAQGTFTVLEDNVRTPSGVSYVLENRMMMKKVFPRMFRESQVRGVETYPTRLREAMAAVSPAPDGSRSAVLTPGPFNSAYFEHSFLARNMGLELVQGSDLFVDDDRVYAKTTRGSERIDVLYRRIDDDFLDPRVVQPRKSMLGVPACCRRPTPPATSRSCNAVGNGVADDKASTPTFPT